MLMQQLFFRIGKFCLPVVFATFFLSSCSVISPPATDPPIPTNVYYPLEINPLTQEVDRFTLTLTTESTNSNPPTRTYFSKESITPKDAALQAALLDLSERLAIDLGEIKVISMKPDEFPPGDLGCPSENDSAQPKPALVSGYVIDLEVSGRIYQYRARWNNAVFCSSD